MMQHLRHLSQTRSFASAAARPKHSGIQCQVFALYRTLLRAAASKDKKQLAAGGSSNDDDNNHHPTSSSSFVNLLDNEESTTFSARHKFRSKAESLTRREIDRIEHGIRQGEKYVKLLQMDGVSGGTLR